MKNRMEEMLAQPGTSPYKAPERAFARNEIHSVLPEQLEENIFNVYDGQIGNSILHDPSLTDEDIIVIDNKIVLVRSGDIQSHVEKKEGVITPDYAQADPQFSGGDRINHTIQMVLQIPRKDFLSAYATQLHEKMAALGLNDNSTYSIREMNGYYQAYDGKDQTKRKAFSGGFLVQNNLPQYKL